MDQEERGLQKGLHALQRVHVGIRGAVADVHPDDVGQLLRARGWEGC